MMEMSLEAYQNLKQPVGDALLALQPHALSIYSYAGPDGVEVLVLLARGEGARRIKEPLFDLVNAEKSGGQAQQAT